MNSIWIFRHMECEGPGFLGELLDAKGVDYRIIAIDQGSSPPESITGAAALVFMGGPMSVNDPLPWIEAECRLIRQAVNSDLPVLGHCLGGQLICKALGGTVQRNPVREIGWFPVERIPGRASEKWLAGLPRRFEVFHWHGETFSIPTGAERILGNTHCRNQGFALGKTLALQCHIEMTVPMVREWAELYQDELAETSASVQSADAIVENVEQRVENLQVVARRLYNRWLESVKQSC
ncbi:MAG: GMP synthase [Gammaproteobacteria bacterium]